MRRVRTLVAFVLAAIILGAAGTFLYVRLADMPKEIRPDYVPRQTLLTDVVNADWLKNAALPLVPISSGSFLMGNGDARPVHRVNITCAFHMSATEITQAQFRDVLHESPSLVKGDNLPVENVSWRNATGFCRKLTKLESLRGNLPVGMEYRLPTEAEWEYCCRAGGSGEFSSGDDQKLLGAFAWSKENSEGKTHPVGTKKPNAWGLYDMHGNVSEYCFDWFGGYPPGAQEQTDPFCRANSGFRVLRGGSCITPEVDCRSAARSKLNPEEGGPSVGFRVVLAERVASPTPKVLTMAALVPIKPGAFMMGSNMGDENEKPVHRVNITRAFYMSTTKVTQSQYRAVMNECPEDYKGDDTPVVVVTWLEAVELCRKLTEEERRKGSLPDGMEYRLPTEAEWEYCCRAGSSTEYFFGDDAGRLGDFAWYEATDARGPQPVGGKEPNAWGLYDMYGSVPEWCLDWYAEAYSELEQTDPVGPAESTGRVVRGNDSSARAAECRSASRSWNKPENRCLIGFRVVLAPPIVQP